MLLALASVVFLGSESLGTRDHILLSHADEAYLPRRCLAMDSILLSRAEAGRHLTERFLAIDVCCCHALSREAVYRDVA
jgi:hypothetical protein